MIVILTALANVSYSQMTVGEGVVISLRKGTPVNFVISGDVTFKGQKTDLSACTLQLTGVNQLLTANTVVLQSLIVNGQTNAQVSLTGEWDLGNLQLLNGLVTPASDAKILFSGPTQPQGNANSYVNGIFYNQGKGQLLFPIGNSAGYFPSALNNTNSNSPFGMSVVQGNSQFQISGEITEILNTRYYELSADIGATAGSTISLSLNGLDNLINQQGLVVLQSDAISGTATTLGGQEGLEGYVSSTKSPGARYLTIGRSEKPTIIIYDLISPFTQDGKNDKLKISNIGFSIENKVTLLDRWGAVVKEWKNFRNYDDPINPNTDNFDFTKLTPGNYICVAEYKFNAEGATEKSAQMITVLKTN
jgi:hypothetical protein